MQLGFKNIKNNFKVDNNHLIDIDPTQRAWIEVNGNAISNNVRKIRSSLKSKCKFMAVEVRGWSMRIGLSLKC